MFNFSVQMFSVFKNYPAFDYLIKNNILVIKLLDLCNLKYFNLHIHIL